MSINTDDAIVSRQARAIRVLACLQRGPGLNAGELSAAMGVSRRTVFRDLNLLRDAGIEIHFDPESAAYRIATPAQRNLTPHRFEMQDLMHLTIAAQSSLLNGLAPFASGVREAMARLLANYSGEINESLSRVLNGCSLHVPERPTETVDPTLLYQFFDAIRQRRRVRVQFLGPDEEDSSREVARVTQLSPYRIIVATQQLLIEGRSSYHRSRKAFRLDKVQSVQITADTFMLPSGIRFKTPATGGLN